jgi:ribosomal protein S18 acetylase RimI-like enzyme
MNTYTLLFINTEYKVKSVSLHCRVSNTAAINLYFNTFKYRCVDELKRYYEDGEK